MSVEGRVSSVLLSPGREKPALQVNPADVPALEIKLGALVVLLTVTLLFGFAPLCIIRGAGRCSVDSGKKPGTTWTIVSSTLSWYRSFFFSELFWFNCLCLSKHWFHLLRLNNRIVYVFAPTSYSLHSESAVGVRLSLVLLTADLRRRLLSLISCFAGGVFLATCLLDLLPDYLQGITEAFSSAGITVRAHTSQSC